ncbi:hypothetical protein [Cryptosporangium arvum]|uniref:Lipoprotein LpqN n=1 Tax=Cryptosporangium arvum DSM 44712 TaxID=927661 RepID=A0A010YRG3_9ACTN|nr:hypothetical protein [Cryptosporangium arvum]EXG82770.1 hypothetical protein CryarDRAFT_3971 [Cryptosporangium arvum DSM 44712]
MRRTGIALLVALSFVLAGCDGQLPVVTRVVAGAEPSASSTGSAPPVAPTVEPGRHLTAEEARAALPDESSLPGRNWESPPSREDPVAPTKPEECGQVGHRGPLVQAGVPDVLETVTYRTKDPQALDAKFFIASWPNVADRLDLDQTAALVDRCRSFVAYDGVGKGYPVTLDRLTPPPVGEKQFAVRYTVTGDGYLTITWVVIGHTMVQLSVLHDRADDQATPFRPVFESIVNDRLRR